MDGWASVKKAAKYADISERTMRDWLKSGLKHSKPSGGMIRIRYSDIDDYLLKYQVNENFVDAVVDEILRDFN
jgi:excisionase family DNA binding protein